MMRPLRLLAAAAGLLAVAGASAAPHPTRPTDHGMTGLTGNIRSVGSDTMNNLMTLWCEALLRTHPDVRAEIEGKGSATAPPALIAGAATFGPMSRPMTDKEESVFVSRFGYPPTAVRVAIDLLAIYVHRDNPLRSLTLRELDAIFSSTRKRGAPDDLLFWGQLGLEGEWADQPIVIYGRNRASGTYGYLRKHGLLKGEYKESVIEQPGSAAVVKAVADHRFAIGYSGIGYRTDGVHPLALAHDELAPPALPTPEAAENQSYPLARFLHIYLNLPPGDELEPIQREFLDLVLSPTGQDIVVQDGYVPLKPEALRTARNTLRLP